MTAAGPGQVYMGPAAAMATFGDKTLVGAPAGQQLSQSMLPAIGGQAQHSYN